VQKQRVFIIGSQGTHLLQCVVEAGGEAYALAKGLTPHSTFWAEGVLCQTSQSKTGGLELHVSSLQVEVLAQTLPISPASAPGLRQEHRIAELKFPQVHEYLRSSAAIEQAMRCHLTAEGYVGIHSPKIMGGVSESGSEVFTLEYFGEKACLAQSPQFYKQIAICSGLQRVFEIGPVFRAEPSYGPRHLTEFQGVDLELAWVTRVEELIEAETGLIKAVFRALGQPEPAFGTLSLPEAQALFAQHGIPFTPGEPLSHEQEQRLYALTGIPFLFVTGYPISCRPFYHRFHEGSGTTESFELLYKGLEITTGSIREHRLEVLSSQALQKGLTLASIEHYLQAFAYGAPPHGGFGLGLERFVMQYLGLPTVREACFIARSIGHLYP
jgi:aspartyl-tRNA synthetase